MYRIFVLLVGIKATSFFPGQFLGTAPNVCRQKSAVEELGGSDIFPDLHPDDVKCGGNYDGAEGMITSPYIPNVRQYNNLRFQKINPEIPRSTNSYSLKKLISGQLLSK